jgi:hypothetical protein
MAHAVYSQSTSGPNSGSSAVNTALTGSSASWSGVSNALASDNSYTSASLSTNGDFTDHLIIADFGFNISASDIILGIEVEIERFGDKVKDNQIRIVKGGTVGSTDKSATVNWPNTDPNTYRLYGASNDLWGETWLPADINAANFGVAISARRVGGGGGVATPRIDHVRITIHFETPLPVKLTQFEAHAESRLVKLHWETAWEEGNSHFEVQRSSSDLQFTTIGFVAGKNNSDELVRYDFTDSKPLSGYNYYRLKQHDFNGAFDFSEVIKAKAVIKSVKHIYPTVVDTETKVSLDNFVAGAYSLYITDTRGKFIKVLNLHEAEVKLPRSIFPEPGIFIYRLLYKGEPYDSGKLIVR